MNIYRLQWTNAQQEREGHYWFQEFYCWKKDLDTRVKELKRKHSDNEFDFTVSTALLDKPITRDRMADFLNNWFGERP